ncbi:MAG: hypothetical protein A2Z31_05000 [candidate division NC10 bacterium RBG_16_65_8]|nr:MAG: hypothetical protein A2Z31_05000 [candidate division NC10 bacterium RBG_16_65_8]
MRIIEALTLQAELDPWLSLEALSRYSGLSVRSLRVYLADAHRPLPHYRMKEPHVITEKAARKDGEAPRQRTVSGKILVRRSDFDRWMEDFRYTPDLDKIVNEIMTDLQK